MAQNKKISSLCSTNIFRSKRFCGGQKFYILNIADVASWLHITGIVLYKESLLLTGGTAYSFPRGKQRTYNRLWKTQCLLQHNSALCCLPTSPLLNLTLCPAGPQSWTPLAEVRAGSTAHICRKGQKHKTEPKNVQIPCQVKLIRQISQLFSA